MTLVDLNIRPQVDGDHSHVGVITLNDPSRRNALSSALVADLLQAIDTAEGSPEVGALVISGAPPVFCSGADLGKLGVALAEGTERRSASLEPMMITAGGQLAIGQGEEVVKVRESQRTMIALYVGGMGAKGKNFYNELAVRYGRQDISKIKLQSTSSVGYFRRSRIRCLPAGNNC
jgi:1,4-dihydroxy-2-naphthoyl-CoA synthase